MEGEAGFRERQWVVVVMIAQLAEETQLSPGNRVDATCGRVGEGEGFVVKLEDANAAAPSGSPAGKPRRRTERRLCRSDLGGAFGCEQWEHAPMHPQPMCMRRCCCTISHVCVAATRELMFLTSRLRGRY